MTKITPFVKQLVLEFYCYLSKDIYDQSSLNYGSMKVRGRLISFCPMRVNEFLESEDYQGIPTHPPTVDLIFILIEE